MSLAEFDRTTDQAMEAVGILSGGCVDACAVRTSLGAMIMAFTRMLERSTLTGANLRESLHKAAATPNRSQDLRVSYPLTTSGLDTLDHHTMGLDKLDPRSSANSGVHLVQQGLERAHLVQ